MSQRRRRKPPTEPRTIPTTVPGDGPELMLPYVEGIIEDEDCLPRSRRIELERAIVALFAYEWFEASRLGRVCASAVRAMRVWSSEVMGAIATGWRIAQSRSMLSWGWQIDIDLLLFSFPLLYILSQLRIVDGRFLSDLHSTSSFHFRSDQVHVQALKQMMSDLRPPRCSGKSNRSPSELNWRMYLGR